MADLMQIKVVYLSYDGLSDPLGQSQIMPYVAGLSKLNYRFTVISFEKKDKYKELRNEILKWSVLNQIDWIPIQYHKNPPVLSTLYDLFLLWQNVRKGHLRKKFKIIHCRSYLTSIIGLMAKRKYGLKLIFDMRGFWADERVEGGLWNLRNPIYKFIYIFFKRKERQLLEGADHTISLTETAKKEIESWRLKHSPITVIPTCVDLELFDPMKVKRNDQDRLKQHLGIEPGDFVLIYLGSWGTWYLTDEMLKFYLDLKSKVQNAKFLIVSQDDIDLKEHKSNKDIIISKSDRQTVPVYLSIANYSIFFIKPSYSKKGSSATKLGELMAMKIPVVTNKGWGDIQFLDFGSQIQLVEIGESFSMEWLNSKPFPDKTPGLETLSLSSGIKKYDLVYQHL